MFSRSGSFLSGPVGEIAGPALDLLERARCVATAVGTIQTLTKGADEVDLSPRSRLCPSEPEAAPEPSFVSLARLVARDAATGPHGTAAISTIFTHPDPHQAIIAVAFDPGDPR